MIHGYDDALILMFDRLSLVEAAWVPPEYRDSRVLVPPDELVALRGSGAVRLNAFWAEGKRSPYAETLGLVVAPRAERIDVVAVGLRRFPLPAVTVVRRLLTLGTEPSRPGQRIGRFGWATDASAMASWADAEYGPAPGVVLPSPDDPSNAVSVHIDSAQGLAGVWSPP